MTVGILLALTTNPISAASLTQKNCLIQAKQMSKQKLTEAKTTWDSARSKAATALQTGLERAKHASRHEPYEKFEAASIPLSVHRKAERAAALTAYHATLKTAKKTYEAAKVAVRKMEKNAGRRCGI